MTKILEAKPFLEIHTPKLKAQIEALTIKPSLAVILVGQHPSSLLYVKNKISYLENVGAKSTLYQLDQNIEAAAFIDTVNAITHDSQYQGVLIQLPVPPGLQKVNLRTLIPAHKDVDGFHPQNISRLYFNSGDFYLTPCTPSGILSLLQFYNIEIEGKNIAILGRSHIVGKPLSLILENKNATVTLCHSQTQNIKEITKAADIIISAMGKPHYINSSFLSLNKNQILIDVGISKLDGKTVGDMNFADCLDHCSAITPVPGGVGPMTVYSLAQNLFYATINNNDE